MIGLKSLLYIINEKQANILEWYFFYIRLVLFTRSNDESVIEKIVSFSIELMTKQ